MLVLQGGYNLNSISESFSACVDVMLGGVPPRIEDVTPGSLAVKSIKNVISAHTKYWKMLCCDGLLYFLFILYLLYDIETGLLVVCVEVDQVTFFIYILYFACIFNICSRSSIHTRGDREIRSP